MRFYWSVPKLHHEGNNDLHVDKVDSPISATSIKQNTDRISHFGYMTVIYTTTVYNTLKVFPNFDKFPSSSGYDFPHLQNGNANPLIASNTVLLGVPGIIESSLDPLSTVEQWERY